MHVEGYIKKLKPRVEGENLWIKVGKSRIHEVLRDLKSLGLYRISSITGTDNGKDMEVIYHLIHKNRTINLRVYVSKKNPSIETVTDIYPGANLFERELYEMMGIDVRNHPNPKRLFLDKNSPENPLRKD